MENKELNKSREMMYRLLSRLYLLEVDEPLLKALKEMNYPTESPEPEFQEGYEKIAAYLKGEGDETKLLEDLAVDYARVFLAAGVAQGKAAFPYQSVYLGGKQLVMQESNSEAAALYQERGLEPSKDMYRVPEDHIGLLMGYMAELCQEPEQDLEGQREFVSKHLASWVPAFTGEMAKYSSTGFYQGLARLTRGFVKLEQLLLAE